MKTLTKDDLTRSFPPTRSILTKQFKRANGWITNGYFAIREQLEPKFSKVYRYVDYDTESIEDMVNKTTEKLQSRDMVFYEPAQIMNHFELSFDKTFLVELKSEHFQAWCNPRYLSYLLQGVTFIKDIEVMIGKDYQDPIVVGGKYKEPIGLLMGVRRGDQDV